MMNRNEYSRAVLLGVVIGMSFLITFNVFTSNDKPTEATTPKTKFEVVDTYKGCDLLRWSDNQMATYKYFLHCPS